MIQRRTVVGNKLFDTLRYNFLICTIRISWYNCLITLNEILHIIIRVENLFSFVS